MQRHDTHRRQAVAYELDHPPQRQVRLRGNRSLRRIRECSVDAESATPSESISAQSLPEFQLLGCLAPAKRTHHGLFVVIGVPSSDQPFDFHDSATFFVPFPLGKG
jgi:hypothetical protein